MSGNKIFVDTNILLYFLKGDREVMEMLSGKFVIASFITELELLAFPEISQEAMGTIHSFLKSIQIVNINSEIKKTTIDIRKQSKLKLPDAIIAATALYLKIPLLTADKKFGNVDHGEIIIYEI